MHMLLLVVQILLALHTAMGAFWKFTTSEQAVPSLSMIPHGVWLAMGVIELLLAVGLVLPHFKKNLAKLVPISALCIAAEMVIFCILHLTSGVENHGEMIYWLVVAVICVLLAYGRFKVKASAEEE